jgi:hypothetical protein
VSSFFPLYHCYLSSIVLFLSIVLSPLPSRAHIYIIFSPLPLQLIAN